MRNKNSYELDLNCARIVARANRFCKLANAHTMVFLLLKLAASISGTLYTNWLARTGHSLRGN